MAVTLADVLKVTKEPMQKAFILDLLRNSDLMRTIPFVKTDGLKVTDTRWQTLPSAGFRKFGGGYTESTGRTEDVSDTLALLGGDIKIDRVGTKVAARGTPPLKTQMAMKAKAVSFAFTDQFINGDHAVDPDGFNGVKVRVSNMPARQTIDLAVSTDSLKVLASAANEKTFLDALHAAIKYVDGATHIFANETTVLKFGTLLRDLGLAQQIELYDFVWDSFNKKPIIDVGLKGDKSTEIITNTEDPGDGGNDATSIYVARVDTEDGLCGIQLQDMGPEIYDPLNGNEMEAGPQYLRRIDWAVGLKSPSQYSICRIKGFKMAAS